MEHILTQFVRIEHSVSCKGPFQTIKDEIEELEEFFIRHYRFQTLIEELYNLANKKEVLYIYSDYYCAYESIEQLQQWTTKEEIDYLINKLDFNIYLIEGYAVIGEDQVIFKKSQVISQTNINSLFNL